MVPTAEKHQNPLSDGEGQKGAGPKPPAAEHCGSGTAKPGADHGPEILPDMEHCVWLMRKVRNVSLIRRLLKVEGIVLPEDVAKKLDRAKGILLPTVRKQLFPLIAAASMMARRRLERIAERIFLLDDEYGKEAVLSLLDGRDSRDATVLSDHGDRHGRALYLYLEQEYPDKEYPPARFDHAERVQVMNRQTKSEAFSNHYRGPKGLTPHVDESVKQAVMARILELYPNAPDEAPLIEHFTRTGAARTPTHDESDDDGDDAVRVVLDVLTITFNGAEAHYTKVEHGEEVAHDDVAALSIRFSYERVSGAISVFSDDRENRLELAGIFRDELLASGGDISDMPIQQFNITGFVSEAILSRLMEERVPGIESISIVQIKVARSMTRRVVLNAREGREMNRPITSRLAVMRDRYDDRNIYQAAREDLKVHDLSQFDIAQVTLKMRIAKHRHRKAHDITVQITPPEGLNDKMKAEDDRKLVMAQLRRLGILIEI